MIVFFKSLFRGGRQSQDLTDLRSPDLQHMSMEQLVAHIDSLASTTPVSHATALTKRLYEIALYDNKIPAIHREIALKLLGTLKSSIETSLAGNPEATDAFRKANCFMEDNVRRFGVGSLVWLLDEHSIPAAEITSFVMRPEHGHLLADFLPSLTDDGVTSVKPELVRQLILSRRPPYPPNAVLILHGLVTKGDNAAKALFTPDEYSALLHVPENYQSGRLVLAQLGLLSIMSNARTFPDRDIESLVCLSILAAKDFDETDHLEPRLNTLSAEHQSGISLARKLLRIQLVRSILEDTYGKAASDAFIETFSNDECAGMIERFHRQVQILIAMKPGTKIDFALVLETLATVGLAPENEEAFEQDRECLEIGENIFNLDRVAFQHFFRFGLRWTGDPSISILEDWIEADR